MTSARRRQASAFDAFSLPHFFIGALAGASGVPRPAAWAAFVGWEATEELLRPIAPKFFRYEELGHDTIANKLGDVSANGFGYEAGRAVSRGRWATGPAVAFALMTAATWTVAWVSRPPAA